MRMFSNVTARGWKVRRPPNWCAAVPPSSSNPFGTLKCRAGYLHFLVRGFDKVRGEWSLMALCYNFTRVLNILGFDRFVAYLAEKAQNARSACEILLATTRCAMLLALRLLRANGSPWRAVGPARRHPLNSVFLPSLDVERRVLECLGPCQRME